MAHEHHAEEASKRSPRSLRYEGSGEAYLYICAPQGEDERVYSMLETMHDYGYRFFVPLPGDENLDGDSGFFFGDDRMEQAHRVMVILPPEGEDALRTSETEALRDWMGHHSPQDVLVVHLGEGEATGPLDALLREAVHLRPAGGTSREEFNQQLLDLLLPREYDPARDASLRAGKAEISAETGRARRILGLSALALLLLPLAASFVLAPASEPVSNHLSLAADLLVPGYGLMLVIAMAQWNVLRRAGEDPAGAGRMLRGVRIAFFLMMNLLLTLGAVSGAAGESVTDAAVALVWRSALDLGVWALLESALCLATGTWQQPGDRDSGALLAGLVLEMILIHGLGSFFKLCPEPALSILTLCGTACATLLFPVLRKVCAIWQDAA